ncbi:MAG: hypothetical protein DHS20C15_16220 [Planctomycetota bacterium]|nr:MAG: hypothetical protein DHS20C15_16220 [Planctomycetota bacterium]
MSVGAFPGLAAGGLVLALLLVLGWGPSARSFAARRSGLAERVARALAWGAALWGLCGFALNVAGFAVSVWQLAVFSASSALLCGLARALSRNAPEQPAPERPSPASPAHVSPAHAPLGPKQSPSPSTARVGRLATLLLLPVLLIALASTLGQPLCGDGSKFWLPKAYDSLNAGVPDTPALQDSEHLGFHRNYPLLGPVLLAPALQLAAPDNHLAAKTVLAGLHVALLVLLVLLLKREGAAGAWLALLAVAMPVWLSADAAASPGAGGLMDGVLALFLLLLVDAVDALRRRGCPSVHDAALWIAALACIKLEGGVAAALVLGVALLVGPRREAWWAVLLPLLATVMLLGVFLLSVPASPPITKLELLRDPSNLAVRVPVLLTGFVGVLTDAARFGLLPLGLLTLALSRPGRRAGFAWLLLLGVAAFLSCVYLSTTMHLGRHLETSAHRLALQWLPAFALLAARAVSAPSETTDGR